MRITPMVTLCASLAFAFTGTGSGTAKDPYVISTHQQWLELDDYQGQKNAETYFALGNDILIPDSCYASNASYQITTEMGGKKYGGFPMVAGDSGFYGILDGKGHSIQNILIHSALSNRYNIAPIRINKGTIKNLHIEKSYVEGAWYTGGLVGENNGIIDSSTYSGQIEGSWHTGGLVGLNKGEISYCSTQVAIEYVSSYAGGLVGSNYSAIRHSSATGTLVGGVENIGGLVGYNKGTIDSSIANLDISIWNDSNSTVRSIGGFVGNHDGQINHGESRGKVQGYDNVGGFVGIMFGGTIKNSGARGSVYQTFNAAPYASLGGFIGNHQSGSIQNSYARGEVFAQSGSSNIYAGGFVGIAFASIQNSLATGDVHAAGITGYTGGFGGSIKNKKAAHCFSVGNIDFPGSQEAKTGGFVGWTDSLDYNASLAVKLTGGDTLGLLAGILKNGFRTYALKQEIPGDARGYPGSIKDSSTFSSADFWKDSLTFSFGNTEESPWVYNSGLHPWLYFMSEAQVLPPGDSGNPQTDVLPSQSTISSFSWEVKENSLRLENRSRLPLQVELLDVSGRRLMKQFLTPQSSLAFDKPAPGLYMLRFRSGTTIKGEMLRL